jgi:hypothetical protein
VETFYARGEFATRKELTIEQHASARARDDAQSQAAALDDQALALLALGEADQALPLLDQVHGLLAVRDYLAEEVLTHGLTAVAYLRCGDGDQALAAAGRADDFIDKVPTGSVALDGYAGVAEVALALWEADDGQSAQDVDNLRGMARHAITALKKTS